MTARDEHQPQCGHVLDARLTAVLNVLQGYIKSDMESQKPLMPNASHTFFMHFMGIAREALEEYESTWDAPSTQQVIQASEFVLRPWKP